MKMDAWILFSRVLKIIFRIVHYFVYESSTLKSAFTPGGETHNCNVEF